MTTKELLKPVYDSARIVTLKKLYVPKSLRKYLKTKKVNGLTVMDTN
jgi:hypothetical protein